MCNNLGKKCVSCKQKSLSSTCRYYIPILQSSLRVTFLPKNLGKKCGTCQKSSSGSICRYYIAILIFSHWDETLFFPKIGVKNLSAVKKNYYVLHVEFTCHFFGGLKNFKILKHRNHRSKQDNIITYINTVCQNKGPSSVYENRKIQRCFQGIR